MANLNSVTVVEVCKVAPPPTASSSSPNINPHSFSLSPTFFDLLWLRFPPVQRIFFYKISSSSYFFDSILPKLKASLSTTLQHFLPLAGAITWPENSSKPVLTYVQGDAVSLTVAKSTADFHSLISSTDNFVHPKEYHPLVPPLAASHDEASVMALQITAFPDGGFSIGTTVHHASLDGNSSTLFLKSWAYICKHDNSSLLPNELKPVYDRTVMQDRTGLDSVYVNQFLNMDRPNNRSLMFTGLKAPPLDSVRGSFEFASEKIEALRNFLMAKRQQQCQPVQYLSTFCVTCAYTWVCLVKTEEIKSDTNLLVFNVNCRSRLDPPMPANYFGNCIKGCVVVAETKGMLGEDGLLVAVDAITEGIKGLENGILNGAESWISNLYSLRTERLFSIAGSPRFKLYDTDFGWGRPWKTDMVSIDRTGAVSFSDSKNVGGGLEIGLVLKKQYMDAFASLFAKGLEGV